MPRSHPSPAPPASARPPAALRAAPRLGRARAVRAGAALLLAALLAGFGWLGSGSALAEEGAAAHHPRGAVILANGERMACRLLGTEGERVRVEAGDRTYRLERIRLRALVVGEGPELAPRRLDWVGELALRREDPDPQIAASAAAALEQLGEEGSRCLHALAGHAEGLLSPVEGALKAAQAALAAADVPAEER